MQWFSWSSVWWMLVCVVHNCVKQHGMKTHFHSLFWNFDLSLIYCKAVMSSLCFSAVYQNHPILIVGYGWKGLDLGCPVLFMEISVPLCRVQFQPCPKTPANEDLYEVLTIRLHVQVCLYFCNSAIPAVSHCTVPVTQLCSLNDCDEGRCS